MEVMKDVPFNPIMQDESKGKPRYYTYGVPFFNYGLLPQTWEDPYLKVRQPASLTASSDRTFLVFLRFFTPCPFVFASWKNLSSFSLIHLLLHVVFAVCISMSSCAPSLVSRISVVCRVFRSCVVWRLFSFLFFFQDAQGHGGDNDPLDVMEVGDGPLVMGTMVAIKVLG